ncbi:metallophosphoesterase family protein [Thioalkalivibrio sulfidiphilus]|uniref:metallophosphoesterase family protein n=1 Tax=Thioalkalivibrio sulfidiphilus TaxID=1033854 RepID=UPI0004767747|nr:metallophosphoesterase family protein [Thioalkalivibrio sulfidiphilus]
MKICIVSDSHDRGPMLARAIEAAIAEGAALVIHCGDLIGGNTIRASLALGVPIHAVHGNNLGDPVAIARIAHNSKGMFIYHGLDADITVAGRRIFVTHYPHYGHAMACTGDFDLVCCGHSHEPEIRQQSTVRDSQTWLINPGTVAGLGAPEATWILGDLETMKFELRQTPD